MKENPDWTEELIKKVASEMYDDGTSECERYSEGTWKSRQWPSIDDKAVIEALNAYMKFLKMMDIYNGKEIPKYRTEFSIGIRRATKEFKKT